MDGGQEAQRAAEGAVVCRISFPFCNYKRKRGPNRPEEKLADPGESGIFAVKPENVACFAHFIDERAPLLCHAFIPLDDKSTRYMAVSQTPPIQTSDQAP